MAKTLNIDKLFVSKIIHSADMGPAADIPSHFLFESDYKEAFNYIRDYYAQHSVVPTRRVMRLDCPDVDIVEVDEPWEDIIKRLQDKYVKGLVDKGMDEVADAYEQNDQTRALNLLGALVTTIHTAIPSKRDVIITETGDERLARYRDRRDNPGMMVGIPTGFPTIDKATQGLQAGQLVTLTGLTKASKSVVAMLMAKAAQEHGQRVLYLTYEMTVDEQTNRLDAYRAGFNDNKLNSGNLSEEDMVNLTRGVHQTAALPPMMISEDCMTVTAIGAKCDSFEPDIVFVDGAYMLDDEKGESTGSPQALANIVAGLKFMAMRRKICIVVITQATAARTKGEVLNNDSIMGSRAFGFYSNVVIGIERTDDPTIRTLRIIMSRSCAPCTVSLQFDFDTATFQELEGEDFDVDLVDDEEFEGDF